MKAMLKKLQTQLDEETSRLRDVHDKRDKDLQFAENANYTSNEEGMGVSPTQYELQNKMPVRPGVRQRTPQREIPFGDPRAPL